MADEVIIRDHAGNEHVFPSGFDPAQAVDIVKRQNLAAGRTPLGDATASVPEDTFSKGFHEGLKKEPLAGGAVGFAEALPAGLVQGAWDTVKFPITATKYLIGGSAALLTDPVGTLTKVRDTITGLPTQAKKAFDDAIQLAATDPEGWGNAVGQTTGAVEGGLLASKIPVKPGIRLLGKGMQAAGEHPFAARMSGGAMLGRGVLKGDVPTAVAGIGTMALPKLLTTTGKALREFSGEDLSTALPSGARSIDVGDTSRLGKGIRVAPPAGPVRPQPTGAIPATFGTAAVPEAATATGFPTLEDLMKTGLTRDQATTTLTRMQARAGAVRPQGAPRPSAPPITPTEAVVEDAQRGYRGPEQRVTTGTSPTGVERRGGPSGGSVAEQAAEMRKEGITPPASKPEGAAMVNKAVQEARAGGVRTTPPAKPVPPASSGATDADIIALRTEHGAEEAGTKLARDPRFAGMSKTQRTNAIRDIAGDDAGLLPSGAQRDIDAKLKTMRPDEAEAYLAKAPNAAAYNYIVKRLKALDLLVDSED